MITAPGAPSTGLAAPLRTPPSPSPTHHTATDHAMDAPSPTFTVGRQAMARAMAICTRAKKLSVSTAWCPMDVPDQLIGLAMRDGLPWDIPEIICRPKFLVKKKDCSCRTPSSNQEVASTSCRALRPSGRDQAPPRVTPSAPAWAESTPDTPVTVASVLTRTPPP